MNGIVLLCGALGLAGSPDSMRPADVVPLGTGGTVLRVPDRVHVDYKQVETPRGPEIRLTVGRRVVQGRTVRWSSYGAVIEMWPGLNGPHVHIRRFADP